MNRGVNIREGGGMGRLYTPNDQNDGSEFTELNPPKFKTAVHFLSSSFFFCLSVKTQSLAWFCLTD